MILRLPTGVKNIQAAADAFEEQFGSVTAYICGHITLEQGPLCLLPFWRKVARLDVGAELVGLGEPGESEEELLWIWTTGPGHLKLIAQFPVEGAGNVSP